MSSGLAIGMPGTYQLADGSSVRSPSAAHSTICLTSDLQEPQPLPARVRSMTSPTLLQPPATAPHRSPFDTPLQLHTWESAGISATPTCSAPSERSTSSRIRSSGRGAPRSNAWVRKATLRVSPSSVAPTSLSSRMTTDKCTPRLGSEITRNSSSSRSGVLIPMTATSTPATLSLVAVRLPWYSASGFVPVRTSASTFACSHAGATRPYTSPRCCAHSPMAYTSGSSVRSWSSTTMPRSTSSPERTAMSVLGRTPAATTSRSASIRCPSASPTPSTWPSPKTSVANTSRCTVMPSDSTLRLRIAPASASSCMFIRYGMACTSSTCRPWPCSARAASRPSSPPPITPAPADGVEHGAGLVDGAEAVDAGQELAVVGADALHRRDERVAAGRQHQVVVRDRGAVGGVEQLGGGVDPLGPDTGPEGDAVVGVPVVAVEHDVVLVLLAGQHRRQHDPVVVAVRLVAEDGDPELLAAAALEHLLDEARAGHAVAHDHQPRAGVEIVVVEMQGR